MMNLWIAWLISFRTSRHRGDDSMQQHGPTELSGPVRGSGPWWRGMGAAPEEPSDGTQAPPRSKTIGRRTRGPKPAPAPLRRALIDRVRGEIAAGTYDTPE